MRKGDPLQNPLGREWFKKYFVSKNNCSFMALTYLEQKTELANLSEGKFRNIVKHFGIYLMWNLNARSRSIVVA